MSAPTIASLNEVTRVYPQGLLEVIAVNKVTLEIHEGDFAAFTGPSGSGKSTLLNILGLLDSPTSGKVVFEGKDVSTLNRTQMAEIRKNRIGFVFQAYNLIPVLTAFENAEMVLEFQGVPPEERRTRVMKILREVGLEGMEHRRPNELSGGQQQRVAIARAIVSKPALVLADEPTANVDSETANSLLDLMQRLNREHNVTFLFSTHDHKVMARAKRIITLRDGKIESDEQRS